MRRHQGFTSMKSHCGPFATPTTAYCTMACNVFGVQVHMAAGSVRSAYTTECQKWLSRRRACIVHINSTQLQQIHRQKCQIDRYDRSFGMFRSSQRSREMIGFRLCHALRKIIQIVELICESFIVCAATTNDGKDKRIDTKDFKCIAVSIYNDITHACVLNIKHHSRHIRVCRSFSAKENKRERKGLHSF